MPSKRATTRPNAAKAFNRIRAEIEHLIDNAPNIWGPEGQRATEATAHDALDALHACVLAVYALSPEEYQRLKESNANYTKPRYEPESATVYDYGAAKSRRDGSTVPEDGQ